MKKKTNDISGFVMGIFLKKLKDNDKLMTFRFVTCNFSIM